MKALKSLLVALAFWILLCETLPRTVAQIALDKIQIPQPRGGSLNVMVSDGKGGVFIGGSFAYFGDSLRTNLVHISSNGQVSSWIANIDSATTVTNWYKYLQIMPSVQALAVHQGILYVGGYFFDVMGQPRRHLAAINIATRTVTKWNPLLDSTVMALAVSDTTLYVGGEFTSVHSKSRKHLAELGLTNGTPTSWNPDTDKPVHLLTISDRKLLYVAGNYTTIDGVQRTRLASFSLPQGRLTPWSPEPDGEVFSVVPYLGKVYVGGRFWNISGKTRKSIPVFDEITGNEVLPSISFSPYRTELRILTVNDSLILVSDAGWSGINGSNIAGVFHQSSTERIWQPAASRFGGGSSSSLEPCDPLGGYCGLITLPSISSVVLSDTLVFAITKGTSYQSFGIYSHTSAPQFSKQPATLVTRMDEVLNTNNTGLISNATTFSLGYRSVLPPGIQMLPNGVFWGIPETTGTFSVESVKAENTSGYTYSSPFNIVVTTSTITRFTSRAPAIKAMQGLPYAGHTFIANGSPLPTYRLVSGLLPPGLTLSADGIITGTPTQHGTFERIVVRAENSINTLDSPPFDITVNPITPPLTTVPKPNGAVHQILSDGSGGIILRGSFSELRSTDGTQQIRRNGLVRLNPDASIHAWDPNIPSAIQSMHLWGDQLYLTLESTTAIIALDIHTGEKHTVELQELPGKLVKPDRTFAVYGRSIFTNSRTKDREYGNIRSLRTFDIPTGYLMNTRLSVDLPMYCYNYSPEWGWSNILGIHQGRLFVEGSRMGSKEVYQPTGLLSFDAATGKNLPINVYIEPQQRDIPTITALTSTDKAIFFGGAFTIVGNQSRKALAAINVSNGSVTSWQTDRTKHWTTVIDMGILDNFLYVAGSTTTGTSSSDLAAFDIITGETARWNPLVHNGKIQSLQVVGNSIFAGGTFSDINNNNAPFLSVLPNITPNSVQGFSASKTAAQDNTNQLQQQPTEYADPSIFPNPSTSVLTLTYFLENPTMVTVELYSSFGEKVATLVHELQQTGSKSKSINTHSLAVGVYRLCLNTGLQTYILPIVITR